MNQAEEFLSLMWFGNSVLRIVAAVGLFLLLIIAFRFVLPLVLRQAEWLVKRSTSEADDVIVSLLEHVPHAVFHALSLLLGLSVLHLPDPVPLILRAGILAILISLTVMLAYRIIEFSLVAHVPRLRTHNSRALPTVLRVTLSLILWSFGVLLLLSNLGINIISLVAGLGIGGIAVALAVQNILSDMFSSFALYMDKPFREGDFIVIGQDMGVVKNVGLKTTRLQALQGEEIIISNRELTESRIQNFKRMNERRVVLRFGVTYDSPSKKLRAVPQTIKDLISGIDSVRFDRAHFATFGDSALEFEVVYYILSAEYNTYMDRQQEINFAIFDRLQAEGLSFAFPTQTVHVVQEKAAT